MIIFSRRVGEVIMIGDDVEITVMDIRGDKVRIGVRCPITLPVHRREVYEAIRRENTDLGRITPRSNDP